MRKNLVAIGGYVLSLLLVSVLLVGCTVIGVPHAPIPSQATSNIPALQSPPPVLASTPGIQTVDQWVNSSGIAWKNGTNELCWRDANWMPATAGVGCDGASVAPAPFPGPASSIDALPTPKAAPFPAPVVPSPAASVAKVSFTADVFFPSGSSSISSQGKIQLAELAKKIGRIGSAVVIVVGHTDSLGSAATSQRLSLQRADAVRNYLILTGVEGNKVFAEGRGKTRPVASNNTAEGRAQNNRVEIEVNASSLGGTSAHEWKPNDRIAVLFGTNRQRTGSDHAYTFYGNRLIDQADDLNLRRGIAVIKVPPLRQRGSITQPGWISINLERLTSSKNAGSLGLPVVRADNPLTDFSYAQPIRELSQTDFDIALNSLMNKVKGRSAVLYIHGYANDFTEGAFRAAQLSYDLATPEYEFVPLLFSWPSDAGVTGMDYEEARRRVQASGYDLARFLKEVAANTDIGTVHIIAHSMGAEVLGHALIKLGVIDLGRPDAKGLLQPLFRQIVFAAPDITPRIFQEVIEPAIRSNHLITAYGATTDLPLWLSTLKNSQPRVGLVDPAQRIANCVDTVDVTAVAAKGLKHSTWAESPRVLDDIRMLLRDGLAPEARGLNGQKLTDRTIWRLSSVATTTKNRRAAVNDVRTATCAHK